MYEQVENPKENKGKTVAQKKSEGMQGIELIDNRAVNIVQRKMQSVASDTVSQSSQKKENKTGLPDKLKSGIENLSGYSMDDVNVHYNSDKPAQLQAHAFAQGSDIHLEVGQEKHLPHEAWHVVQQKQGRVQPTTQLKDKLNINEDSGLEREADAMGAKAMQMKVEAGLQINRMPMLSPMTGEGVTQGYFINRMARGSTVDMKAKFLAVKGKVSYLKHVETQFDTKNNNPRDEGQLFDWLVGTAQPKQKGWVTREANNAGIQSSQFSDALGGIGAHLGGPSKFSPRLDLEKFKDTELDNEKKELGPPVSPRHRSRIIQIPNLIALMTNLFDTNNILRNFDFILGGGSALAFKKLAGGRLGRPSENMRDIDMDFQVKTAGVRTEEYEAEKKKGTSVLLSKVQEEMVKEIARLPGGLGSLRTDAPSLTMGSTIMFKRGDLEYSFHFIDEETEAPLEFDKMNSPDGGVLSVINDGSHWEMTKSALSNRLARPDKIHKTLIDALVLAGTTSSRVKEVARIITSGGVGLGNTLRTLKGLYLKRGYGATGPGLIAGLKENTAKEASNHLDKIKESFMNRKVLSNEEIIAARSKYLGTINAILKDIADKASADNRDQVKTNAEGVMQSIKLFRDGIKGYEHYYNIPSNML